MPNVTGMRVEFVQTAGYELPMGIVQIRVIADMGYKEAVVFRIVFNTRRQCRT